MKYKKKRERIVEILPGGNEREKENDMRIIRKKLHNHWDSSISPDQHLNLKVLLVLTMQHKDPHLSFLVHLPLLH